MATTHTPVRRAVLSVGEVATLLGISERTIRRQIQAQRLRHARVGDRILIAPKDVEDWLGIPVRISIGEDRDEEA